MTKKLGIIALALSMVLAGGCFQQASAEITIKQPKAIGRIDIKAHNRKHLSKVGLRIKRDLSHIGDVEVRKRLEAMSLSTGAGVRVHSFDFDKANDLVIGTSTPGTSVEINLVRNQGRGQDIVVLIRGKDGKFKEIRKSEIGVFSLDGQKKDFSVKPFSFSSIEAYFDILLDRSGSMSGFIDDVQGASADLMNKLPGNAKCRVTSFNNKFKRHSTDFLPCSPNLHKLNSLKAGGGTKIFEPLLESYSELAALTGKLTAVVVITDGVGHSKISKDRITKSKSAPTYVYWLGNYKEDRLRGIADTFIYGRQDVKKLLKAYVSRIGSAVNSQHVISTTNP